MMLMKWKEKYNKFSSENENEILRKLQQIFQSGKRGISIDCR